MPEALRGRGIAGQLAKVGLESAPAEGRIDILTELTGISLDEAWPGRESGRFGDLTVDFLGRDDFIRDKRATGRMKDLGDLEGL